MDPKRLWCGIWPRGSADQMSFSGAGGGGAGLAQARFPPRCARGGAFGSAVSGLDPAASWGLPRKSGEDPHRGHPAVMLQEQSSRPAAGLGSPVCPGGIVSNATTRDVDIISSLLGERPLRK